MVPFRSASILPSTTPNYSSSQSPRSKAMTNLTEKVDTLSNRMLVMQTEVARLKTETHQLRHKVSQQLAEHYHEMPCMRFDSMHDVWVEEPIPTSRAKL